MHHQSYREEAGVGTITLIEVYIVEGLNHNLLSINQLCDAGFQVIFNTKTCIINHPEKKLTLVGDWLKNIYVLNNVDFLPLNCLTAFKNDY